MTRPTRYPPAKPPAAFGGHCPPYGLRRVAGVLIIGVGLWVLLFA